jgi:hypothetical protein
MFKTKYSLLTSLVIVMSIVSPVSVVAQGSVVTEQQGQIAKYVNGGIGDDQVSYMQSIAKNWPLHLMFSQLKANEFVAAVNLKIVGSRNTTFLQLDAAGPLTYVQLPPGVYQITASHQGDTQTRKITIGNKNKTDVHFHWKGSVKNDPFDGKPLGGSQVPG